MTIQDCARKAKADGVQLIRYRKESLRQTGTAQYEGSVTSIHIRTTDHPCKFASLQFDDAIDLYCLGDDIAIHAKSATTIQTLYIPNAKLEVFAK